MSCFYFWMIFAWNGVFVCEDIFTRFDIVESIAIDIPSVFYDIGDILSESIFCSDFELDRIAIFDVPEAGTKVYNRC